MIEEAAGTRMYECKKQQAQKTIEKKDAKLNELNTVLLFQNILTVVKYLCLVHYTEYINSMVHLWQLVIM
jgi:structural maintenance of chromosome 2